ncbi:BEACH domain-containing protein, partial [Pelagophyceae sp. CCMP2097]
WQERRLDNFGYLCVVNALAGRSFNDTCAYPVFPWVVADYVSPVLDLSNPDMFRDLSKPMGALNEARLRETVARYDSFDDVHMPKFHYGSHYSTAAGVVVHYLLRLAPRFAKLHCELQSGRFDVADRLFTCIAEAWNSNSGDRGDKSGGEVKELTPEFFSTPAFLVNRGRLPLGTSQDGRAVGDVELPPWAHGSAETFIQRHRAALESDHVSAHLHLWVDLVFGYKQRGRNAVEARNVFFYLCYADTVDVEAIEDEGLRAATVLQASHFGQCPAQLLR